MLSNLLEIAQRRLKLLDEGACATESSALKLLGAVEGVRVLEQADVIVSDAICD